MIDSLLKLTILVLGLGFGGFVYLNEFHPDTVDRVLGNPPTSSVSASDCPVAAPVCEFAQRLDNWLQAGDFDAVLNGTRVGTITCVEQDIVDAPVRVCFQARVGDERPYVHGFRRYSHGLELSPDGYIDFLSRTLASADDSSDGYGPGQFRLYSVGCGPNLGVGGEVPVGSPCEHRYSVIFNGRNNTADQRLVQRELLVFIVDGSAPEPAIEFIGDGVLLGDEPNIVFVSGGHLFDLGQVYPLR